MSMDKFNSHSKSNKISTLFLVLSNLVPLVGVIFYSWGAMDILILYWAENLVIGFYHVIKMLAAPFGKYEGPRQLSDHLVRGIVTGFFAIHYAGFCLAHGFFIFFLNQYYGQPISPLFLSVSLLALLVSHGVSLMNNYFGQKEYLKTTTQELLFAPYKRIVIMHIVVMLGGIATLVLSLPTAAVIVLVILKINLDLKAHRTEHKNNTSILASSKLVATELKN